jgi:hypothetical protein
MTGTARNYTDIRNLGRAVNDRSPHQALSARSAARLLFGTVGFAVAKFGLDRTQEACADLVANDLVWRTKFCRLPRIYDGAVGELTALIAGAAAGILPMAGAENLRAALAFWATERDPAVWRQMTGM